MAYAMLGWFAYLQAAPGLVVPHLRDEFGLSYAVAGLHVAAFALGGALAGVTTEPLERRIGRAGAFWLGAAGMEAGIVALTVGRSPVATVGATLVAGWLGATLLVTIQAVLADRHGERRAVAFAEANVVASLGYLLVTAALALAGALALGWRAALVAWLVLPLLAWRLGPAIAPRPAPAAAATRRPRGRLPRAFWLPAAVVFFGTAADWCLSTWGASFVRDAADLSTDAAVAVMVAYFAGMLGGRVAGSVLAHRVAVRRVLLLALASALAGFALLWTAGTFVQAGAGLALAGFGTGNLYPLGLALAVGAAPDRAALAGGRVVTVASLAVLIVPLGLGRLADAVGLAAALAVVPVCLLAAAAALLAARATTEPDALRPAATAAT
jgi:fucose permease